MDRSPLNLQILYVPVVYAANLLPNPKSSCVVQLHQQSKLSDLSLLEAEVLQVHAPPFVSKEPNSNQSIGPAFSRVQRRRSFIKKVGHLPVDLSAWIICWSLESKFIRCWLSK